MLESAGTVLVCVEISGVPMGGVECDVEVTLMVEEGFKTGMEHDIKGVTYILYTCMGFLHNYVWNYKTKRSVNSAWQSALE